MSRNDGAEESALNIDNAAEEEPADNTKDKPAAEAPAGEAPTAEATDGESATDTADKAATEDTAAENAPEEETAGTATEAPAEDPEAKEEAAEPAEPEASEPDDNSDAEATDEPPISDTTTNEEATTEGSTTGEEATSEEADAGEEEPTAEDTDSSEEAAATDDITAGEEQADTTEEDTPEAAEPAAAEAPTADDPDSAEPVTTPATDAPNDDATATVATPETDDTAAIAVAAAAVSTAVAMEPLTEATDFAAEKKRYTLWGVGLTCMASEATWFFGSKALLALLRHFGLSGAHINFAIAVAWFPVTMFLLPLGYMKLRGIDSERFAGLRGDLKPANVALVVLAAFSVWALMRVPEALWAEFMHYVFGDDMPHISGIGAYNTIFVIDFVRKCIIPAFFEEYLYRGFMFRGLRGGMGALPAALISSVIFMLMHTDLTNVVAPLALGLLCCYLFEVTGSIFPCMISHFVYNLSSTIGNLNLSARGFQQGQLGFQSEVLGSDFEVTLAVLMACSCLLLLAISLFFIRRGGRYKNSVSINEYAECARKPLDLLPFFTIAAMLVLGYVL